MSFLKRLFGGGSAAAPSGPEGARVVREVEHDGFTVQATPYAEQGQFQTCGVIRKEVGGAMKEKRFIRADRFASADDAADCAIAKGRQMIDEQGERVFG